MEFYYYGIKAMFLFGIVRSFVKYDALERHWLFVAILYTAGLALLSWVFLNSSPQFNTRTWELWLVKTLLLAALYLKLLSRFDEGLLFWLILLAGGAGLILF
jgi:hypothetical protein